MEQVVSAQGNFAKFQTWKLFGFRPENIKIINFAGQTEMLRNLLYIKAPVVISAY